MDHFQKSLRNTFVARGLDRAHHHRKDDRWIAGMMRDPESLFIAVRDSKLLVSEGESPLPVLLKREQVESCLGEDSAFFLGEENGRAYFAVDVDKRVPGNVEKIGRFRDLRGVAPLMSRDDGALLAYAKALIYWNKRNHFCGACGGRNELREGGHFRACINPGCGVMHFPRTDPAIIVLIKSGEKCLLGRQHIWPERMYSVLAGFVEPGESAEGAVAREAFEEVGVRVKNIRYQSSQPWPFPCSLMLGFTAEAEDDRLSLGDEELEDARWLGRGELLEAVENGSVKLPTPVSISFRLIEEWFDAESPFCLQRLATPEFVARRED
jgi:NAD+ diphosphatase